LTTNITLLRRNQSIRVNTLKWIA